MRFFDRSTASNRRTGSHLALAIALATGAAVGVTSFAEPAYAQKKKKKKKKEKEEEKAQYSDEFRAAYAPVDAAIKADPVDHNAVSALLPALIAASKSPHERLATGTSVYNTGVGMNSSDLRLQGLDLMINSGLSEPAQLAQFNAIAFDLTRREEKYGLAAEYAQKAIDAGFSSDSFTTDDLRYERARLLLLDEKPQASAQYLSALISQRRAEGATAPESWYQLATTQAYEYQITPLVYEVMRSWVLDYPSKESWQSSIAMVRNMNNYEGAETLDSVRLGFKVDALLSAGEYLDLVEMVNASRRPHEAKAVIETGISRGMIDSTDPFAREQLGIANEQIQLDRTELPSLESDALAPGANLRTVRAAADTLLSYGMGEKATALYETLLDLPGVDRAEALTRLGMAQIESGDYSAAQATLAKVEGRRFGIANLWSAFAEQKQSEMAPAPAAAPATASAEAETSAGG